MEGGNTLADSLLDDLDDLSDVDDNGEEEQLEIKQPQSNDGSSERASSSKPASRRFLDSPKLQAHIEVVRNIQNRENGNGKPKSRQSDQQEYELVVQSNLHLSSLADELTASHIELCAAYKPKFSELEELIPNPVQYMKAVACIRNETDLTLVNDSLNQFLSSNQIITITVSASTTTGRTLDESELSAIDSMVNYIQRIIQHQEELSLFVESRMEHLAPNVCALIGSKVSAQLLGLAGGLAQLSKIPACNLQVLGQTRQNSASRAGLSTAHTAAHEGLLVGCDLVQAVSKDLRKKALKTVAAKVALAARCDFVNADMGKRRTSDAGAKFRIEVEDKIKMWQEPDKAQTLKALPKPDLTIKKRRGGKRMRRLKERFEETALMKEANKRAFSTKTGEYGDDAMGLTRGLLDTHDVSASGALRKTTRVKKARMANTKASRKRDAQLKARNTNTNGLASSIVFTPVQGMELVNPQANEDRVQQANLKWFQNNQGFSTKK